MWRALGRVVWGAGWAWLLYGAAWAWTNPLAEPSPWAAWTSRWAGVLGLMAGGLVGTGFRPCASEAWAYHRWLTRGVVPAAAAAAGVLLVSVWADEPQWVPPVSLALAGYWAGGDATGFLGPAFRRGFGDADPLQPGWPPWEDP